MVNKMAEEKTVVPLVETDEPEKQNLSEELSNILEDNVTIYAEDLPSEHLDEDYVYVYRGTALNKEELFQLSAREDIRQVLVAGPHSSGKTTLIVMIYHLFLEGYNCELLFNGSLTMEGFKSRSEKTHLTSGEARPATERTPRSEQNRYLHLALLDSSGRKNNLILTDISGELFEPDYAEDLGELYSNCENIILTVDGEKLRDPAQRQNEIRLTIQLLKSMLNSQVMTKRSKLQIICTKRDIIETGEQPENTIQYLMKKLEKIRTNYAAEVYSLEFCMISALNLDDEDTQKQLEQIVLKCIEGSEHEVCALPEEPKLQRYFDKFKMRG